MWTLRGLAAFAGLFAVLFLVACSGGPAVPPAVGAPPVQRVEADLFSYDLPVTATPWPTFTPVPTPPGGSPQDDGVAAPTPTAIQPVRTPGPTVTPVVGPVLISRIPVATFVPTPTPAVAPSLPPTSVPTVSATSTASVLGSGEPTPTSVPRYGQLPGLEVYFEEHRFFVSQRVELDPVYAGTCEGLPLLERVPWDAPFLYWALCFDASGMAGESFEYSPIVRWSYVGRGVDSEGDLVRGWKRLTQYVHSPPLSGPVAYMLTGLGDTTFSPGQWRIELMTEDGEEVIHSWYFEVYAPLVEGG